MNRALRIHAYGGPEVLTIDRLDVPQAGAGEVVVRVRAAGINGLDWKIRDGLMKAVFPLSFPVTLGVEFAGEVAQTGAGVDGFAVGERVMGLVLGQGAYADYAVVPADALTRVPPGLSDTTAASIPVAALTAWQALFDAGKLERGETVLIHGASGGVGSFAVQFARDAGARVLSTAQAANAPYLRGLGADQVIDYRTAAFADVVRDVDLVLDLVGGDVLTASWQVLSAHGRIVSIAAPDIEAGTPAGQRGIWLQMQPDMKKLADVAQRVADGELSANVSEIAGIDGAAAAIERNKRGHGPGKAVIRFD